MSTPIPETFLCRIHKFTQQKSPPGGLRWGHLVMNVEQLAIFHLTKWQANEKLAKGLTIGQVDVAIWKFQNHKAPEDPQQIRGTHFGRSKGVSYPSRKEKVNMEPPKKISSLGRCFSSSKGAFLCLFQVPF